MWQKDVWEIFRGLEKNLANHTNWMIIREFCIKMRNICHFQSLPQQWPSAPPWCSCLYESQMQREQETVDIGYRFNLTPFFSAQFCSRSGAKKQFAKKKQLCLQKTVLLFLCPLEHDMGTLQYKFKSSYSVTWLIGELSFFCKSACSADPARACSLCSRVSSRHTTARAVQPSSRPFRPSCAARSPLLTQSSLQSYPSPLLGG